MHRRDRVLRPASFHRYPSLLRDAEVAAEERLRRGRTEAHEDRRANDVDLAREPGDTRRHLAAAGFDVDSALAARFPLEVLDGAERARPVAMALSRIGVLLEVASSNLCWTSL